MTSSRTTRPVVALLAALCLLTACGQERTSATRIQEDTAAVVTALNAKDYAAARRALATLDADLAAAGRLEQLDAATVRELRAGVATLKADVAALSPTPSPTPRRTTAPPAPRGDDDEKGEGEGKKKRDEDKDDD